MPVDQRALAATLQSLLRTIDLPSDTEGTALVGHLDRVIQAAQEVLGVDGFGLMLLDEQNCLRVVGASDAVGAALERGQQHLGLGPALDCVRADAVVLVPDLAETPEYAALWEWLGTNGSAGTPPVRAILSAPVPVDGSVAGTLNVLRSTPHRWTSEQVEAVEAYAGIMGVMLRLGSGALGDTASARPSAEGAA